MNTPDLSAVAKWPNVPACYGWLSLDRRGDWRLQGERVTHRGLINFINRQYGSDDSGRWFLQNGPQRVFVSLAYTPWIFRRADEGFVSHTGEPAGALAAVHLDADGNVLIACALGIGLLDDRDLAAFVAQCRTPDGQPADEQAFGDAMAGQAGAVLWQGYALMPIAAVDVPQRFNFDPQPQP